MAEKATEHISAQSARRRFGLFCCLALAVFLADLLTKELIVANLSYGQFIPVTSFFNLCHVRNTGAAFSFLSDAGGWQSTFFIALALLLSAALLFWLWRERHGSTLLLLSLSLVLGGALGNCFDRLFRGSVVDFLDFYLGPYHWPAFNVADIAICVGVALLIISEFCPKKEKDAS